MSFHAAVRPKTIPVVVDVPTETPKLDFEKYVEGITAAVLGGSPARYTVGIYGPWGSGKSSLLSAVAKMLSTPPERGHAAGSPIVVRFDAWRYQKADDLIFPLLAAVEDAIVAARPANGSRLAKMGAKLSKFVGALEVSFMGVGARFESGGSEPKQADSSREFWSPFSTLSGLGSSEEESERIVVMVDDLDRCAPDRVMNVLEAIHVLTDIEGFVFVLALDREYLTKAIQERYSEDRAGAERFIEKIVQIPFTIPQRRVTGAVLNDIIDGWNEDRGLRGTWFNAGDERILETIVSVALRSNPRQVKRLINLYLLIRHMEWHSISDTGLLLRVLGLQLALPTDYIRLGWEIEERLSEAETPAEAALLTLKDVEQYRVWSAKDDSGESDELNDHPSRFDYLSTVLTEDLKLDELNRLIGLTSAVNETESEKQTPLQATLADMRVDAKSEFQALLSHAEDLGDDVVSKEVRNYLSIRRMDTSRPSGTVFLSLVPRQGKVLVYLPYLDGRFLRSSIAVRDVRNIGHQGQGQIEVALEPGDGQLDEVMYLIDEAYRLVGRDL